MIKYLILLIIPTIMLAETEKEPALYNDFIKGEEESDPLFSKETTKDFSKLGSQVKDFIKKHNFTINDIPYSVQGLPIIYTSKNTGFNLGLKASIFDFKYKDPYRYSFSAQVWFSDLGNRKHEFSLNIPYFFSKHWSVRLNYQYFRDISQGYYGFGNDSINDKSLTNPDDSNFISRNYYRYIIEYPNFNFDISFKIPRTNFSIYTGLGIEKARILFHDEINKLEQDKPYGTDGGKTNYMKFGLKYDNKIVYTDKGIILSSTFTLHTDKIKSDYNYKNLNFTYMGFLPLSKYISVAQRVMVEQIWGDTPFFVFSEFKSHSDYKGLGGERILRGAPNNRYVDDVKFIHQIELRTKLYNSDFFKQYMQVEFIPYWDLGRVWNKYEPITFKDMHMTFGSELRLIWNKNFIVSFTFGGNKDNFATYLTFGESFK